MSRQLAYTSTNIQFPEDPTTTNRQTISDTIKTLIKQKENFLAELRI